MKSLISSVVAGVVLCSAGLAMAAGAQVDRMFGVWQVISPAPMLRTREGREPPLLPAARQAYEKTRAQWKAGDHRFDPSAQCLPQGVPRLLYEAMPFELIPQRGRVVFMYQWNRLARIAELDQPHTDPLGPTFLGQSVAHWEGQTLIVDTNGFNDSTFLDAAGMPHSDQLHVIERYELDRGGNRLTARMTIEDPATFSAPWDTQARFRRLRGVKIGEDVCVERLGLKQYQ